jgi:hypothetical protein
VLPLGEPLQVKQLPARHDQVANRQAAGSRPAGPARSRGERRPQLSIQS